MSAYQEKNFIFEGVPVHYLEGGRGVPLLLIHGSGPGASTIGNWRLILEPLAESYHVFAMDLIGFGRSGRRVAPPFFDISLWQRQAEAMLALMPGAALGVVGHSISGALALKLAAANGRIKNLVTTGCMGAPFEINDATRLCWTFPEDRAALQKIAEILIHDKSQITEAYLQNRIKTLFEDKDYRAYFSSMFAGPAEFYAAATILTPAELEKIKIPVAMLHGREDRAFPPGITLKLAESLPQADILLLANCAHSIAMEFPQKLLAAITQTIPPA